MMKAAMFTLKLEPELRDQFMAEAAASHQPASQLVREFMRSYVAEQQAVRDHDAWFRAEVEQALREADDPNVVPIPHEQIVEDWHRQRAELEIRASNIGR